MTLTSGYVRSFLPVLFVECKHSDGSKSDTDVVRLIFLWFESFFGFKQNNENIKHVNINILHFGLLRALYYVNYVNKNITIFKIHEFLL